MGHKSFTCAEPFDVAQGKHVEASELSTGMFKPIATEKSLDRGLKISR
jgi:hypothetical protein